MTEFSWYGRFCSKIDKLAPGNLAAPNKKALDFLLGEKWLENSSWYLAGGTALALQAGIRKSNDLDFFTADRDFDGEKILVHFIENSAWQTKPIY